MLDLAIVVYGVITQYPSEVHPAWDIACRRGAPVYAMFDGTLTARYTSNLGHIAEISNPKAHTLYAHLSLVTKPREVKKGELVAYCGNTGRYTTGPHVHIEYTDKEL
jgi:murein DD-endopeptidase MepM/ murein hydrolase activator NlpD